MPTLLQINVTANWGSHGKIAEMIGRRAIAKGWNSYIAYGRNMNPSESKLIKIGSKLDFYFHILGTRLFDKHGLCSTRATRKLIKEIEDVKPDIVHIHNLHGYYINYKVLLEYLSRNNYRVVITMHDCWTMTGHCAHFWGTDCYKWKVGCNRCQWHKKYPSALFIDKSKDAYILKKKLFQSILNLTMVPVCYWLANFIPDSYLKESSVCVIHNGIDTNVFKPYEDSHAIKIKYGIPVDKKMIIGVASIWVEHRGLKDMLNVQEALGEDYVTVFVGLNDKQIKLLSQNCIGIRRTNDVSELAALYSAANVYVNPSYCDSFSTTNIEALSCGTPVVAYKTGGNTESLTDQTGVVVECGDVQGLLDGIKTVCSPPKYIYAQSCRKRAVECFDMDRQYEKYIELYSRIINEEITPN